MREFVSGVLYPYTSDKTTAQKSDRSTKTDTAGEPINVPLVVMG
jgi:hypothetical protein